MAKRHIVCLTFDFDAISGQIAAGRTSPSWMSRGEFGPRVGAPRILALLAKHGIKSTWFMPGHTIETFPGPCEQVVAAGHEIAHHGWTHRAPTGLSAEDEERELVRGNEAIRKISGRNARGYRSPAFDLSPRSVPLLLKHGFVYDSSLMGDDYSPYQARLEDRIEVETPAVFGAETSLVEMPVHWSTDDFPHFEFLPLPTGGRTALMNAASVAENWISEVTYMTETVEWGALNFCFHPYVIGRGARMTVLERLIEAAAARGVVFMTMEDAVKEYQSRKPATA